MSNCFEIAGSCLTTAGGIWLVVDAILVRRSIRSEEGAAKLFEILKAANAAEVLKSQEGIPLNSKKELRLWFASHTIAWNWVALTLISLGFISDLIGKLMSQHVR
jgi:hypothetical protein